MADCLVVLFSGLPGAVNYLFQGKLRLLLLADGKKYVLTNLGTVTFVVTSLSKILLCIWASGGRAASRYCAVNLLQIGFVCLYMYHHYPLAGRQGTAGLCRHIPKPERGHS